MAERTLESSWPINSSRIKLLGFFPNYSGEMTSNDLWIVHCRSMFRSAILLSQQYNLTFQGEYLSYEEMLTDDEVMVTFNRTCEKVSKSQVVGFVGPAYSYEARYLASFAYRLGIADVSYSATSSDLSTIDSGAFYRVAPSDQNTVLGMKMLFEQYKWKSCIIIYQNDEFGYNGMQLLNQKFHEIHIKTFEAIKFDLHQENFPIDFGKTLSHSSSRIVIVWANEISSLTILHKALEANLIGTDFLWILTVKVPLKYFTESEKEKLIGLVTIQSFQGEIFNQTLLDQAYHLWKSFQPNTYPGKGNVHIYGLFTFDAAWTLILSLQKLCSLDPLSCLEFVNSSDCYNQRFLHSKQFYNIIRSISFLGVSGQIQFSNQTPDRTDNIFYIIENIQPFNQSQSEITYVPVLQWNINSTEWTPFQNNTLIWPNRSKEVPIDHKLIQGQPLRIAIIESPPSIILKNATAIYNQMKDNFQNIDLTEFDGFYKDILLYLRDRMGFIPVILLAKPTIRFDELIEGVANNSFDLVMNSIDINAKRNQIADFSIAIMPASYRILVRKPTSLQSEYLISLRPFLWIFWFFLLILIPYTNILIWSVEQTNESSLIRLIIVISYPIYSPFSSNRSDAKTTTGKSLQSILSILQLLLLLVHITGLISFLMIGTAHLSISGIDDIKNGKIPANRIGILVDSYIEEYYLNWISQGKKDYFPLKTPDEVYTRLIQGDIDASLSSNISTAYHLNNIYCRLITVGLEFSHSFYQIPVRHGWLYTQDLNENILSLMASEQLQRISDKWFEQRNCSKTNLFSTETTSLTQATISKFFLTVALTSIISIFVHLCSRNIPWTDLLTLTFTNNPSFQCQFVLINLSSHLNDLSSSMVETLRSIGKDSVMIFEDISTFDFDRLPKKRTVIFTTSEFSVNLINKPKEIEKIFVLENDSNRIDNEERFGSSEDLIYQLADEMSRYYNYEAQTYFKSADHFNAKSREEQANRIHSELKKVHQKFSYVKITTDLSSKTTIIWLTSKLEENIQVESITKLFSPMVSSFLVFDNVSDCREYLSKDQMVDHRFVIIDIAYDQSIVDGFQQLAKMKLVARYGPSSVKDDIIVNNYHQLCFRLTNDLIAHYNQLGNDYSIQQDSKTAEQMFIKAYQLCQMDLHF